VLAVDIALVANARTNDYYKKYYSYFPEQFSGLCLSLATVCTFGFHVLTFTGLFDHRINTRYIVYQSERQT
jgi:hypothetical protein